MKKLFILPLLVLFFAACSVDNAESDILTDNATHTAQKIGSPDVPSCFSTLAGRVNIDVSGGLNNPVVNFIASPPAGIAAANGYMMKIELQSLSDCEDLNSGSGSVTTLGNSTVFYNISATAPRVNAVPSQLLSSCYRWRVVLQGVSSGTINQIITCTSYSQWYDAPLF